jgi:hypothetical protein
MRRLFLSAIVIATLITPGLAEDWDKNAHDNPAAFDRWFQLGVGVATADHRQSVTTCYSNYDCTVAWDIIDNDSKTRESISLFADGSMTKTVCTTENKDPDHGECWNSAGREWGIFHGTDGQWHEEVVLRDTWPTPTPDVAKK